MQTVEKNRLQILTKSLESTINSMLTAIINQLTKIDSKMAKLIEQCEECRIKNKEATSLVGVAPFNLESGSYKGKRMIRGGRSQISTAMYMAMISAIQCNPKADRPSELETRKTGGQLNDRTTKSINKRTIKQMSTMPGEFKTITSDIGIGFHQYKNVEEATNCPYYFANPHHSWEHGTNENTNA